MMDEIPALCEGEVWTPRKPASEPPVADTDATTASSAQAPRPTLGRRMASATASLLPLAIIGGLLYAGFFVKLQTRGVSAQLPVIEKRDRFYGLAIPTEGRVWAAGNYGKVVLSEDGGKSWKSQLSGVLSHLQSIDAWDTQRAVAVGNGGTVIVTADGGNTWKRAAVPEGIGASKLLRVQALAEGKAWAAGEMGTVMTTSDYGATWRVSAAAEDVAWNDVFFVGDSGWLVGEFARIGVSSDGGASWKPVQAPVQSSLSAVSFRDEREGVAVGTEGVIVRTQDGGANWRALPKVSSEHLYDVLWDGGRWLAVGDKGTLLASDASGDRWSEVPGAIGNSAWHTQIAGGAGRYVLAGVGLKTIDVPAASGNAMEPRK